MLRVPGTSKDLLSVKAEGGDVRIVYSPLDSLQIAREHPKNDVVFFAVGFAYGWQTNVYANWGFPDGDLHHQQFHAEGELGMGGPGFDYVVVRYLIRDLAAYFPRGQAFDIGSWSEAESFTESGDLLYHHFAFDRVIDGEQFTAPSE